ncbi:uncharacterized protein B0I36DRAFT_313742 [Microdochium trichocladiopsis]|uniref:Uncharacterized protein n=1 Tax=Microdochium trichocladiopsis TaxID=1682393 RepID=A0A9P8YAX4_9PEZI|nr:uncharacterized protein B0I36DRAFT_313742 [Microdochium trichocladiopsis]KAH7037306.1 hypothetical protein B0I36DRAFT_313742 [Microdochium trichocladiopsis]
MSGYVLQQRTLNKLRTAVIQQMQPRPSPKIFLPDKFKDQATAGESGAFANMDLDGSDRGSSTSDNIDGTDALYIEVRPTVPDDSEESPEKNQQQQQQKVLSSDGSADDSAEEPEVVVEKPMTNAERRRKIKEEIRRLAQSGEPVYYQRRLW